MPYDGGHASVIEISGDEDSRVGVREIVALDGNGMPAFYDLMKRQCRAVYYAFDIMWLNGRDLRELSLQKTPALSYTA